MKLEDCRWNDWTLREKSRRAKQGRSDYKNFLAVQPLSLEFQCRPRTPRIFNPCEDELFKSTRQPQETNYPGLLSQGLCVVTWFRFPHPVRTVAIPETAKIIVLPKHRPLDSLGNGRALYQVSPTFSSPLKSEEASRKLSKGSPLSSYHNRSLYRPAHCRLPQRQCPRISPSS